MYKNCVFMISVELPTVYLCYTSTTICFQEEHCLFPLLDCCRTYLICGTKQSTSGTQNSFRFSTVLFVFGSKLLQNKNPLCSIRF